MVSQLREAGYHYIRGTQTGMKNKEQRLVDQSPRLVSDEYVIPTNVEWYEGLRREFRAFPDGKNDDQVDSVTQFVAWINGRQGQALFNCNPKIGRKLAVKRPSRLSMRG